MYTMRSNGDKIFLDGGSLEITGKVHSEAFTEANKLWNAGFKASMMIR